MFCVSFVSLTEIFNFCFKLKLTWSYLASGFSFWLAVEIGLVSVFLSVYLNKDDAQHTHRPLRYVQFLLKK